MKNQTFIFLISLIFITPSFATIYGDNDMVDIFAVQDQKIKDLSRSVLVQISNNTLNMYLAGRRARTLRQSMLCEGESFIDQPLLGNCTGFLITNTTFLTALHCFANSPCSHHKWVFDMHLHNEAPSSLNIKSDAIYGCKKVLSQSYMNNLDYALVELDRPVSDRTPLEIDLRPITQNIPILSIHSPRGLPLKLSRGNVRDTSNVNHFTSAIDLMRGSSGAPVIDATTYKVIGIVAQGDADYETQNEPFCQRYKRCSENDCRGEYSTRLSQIPDLLEHIYTAP